MSPTKHVLLKSTILALGLEGSLQADTWDYGAATRNWLDALNWSADVVPAANVNVTINHAVAGQTPVITTAVNRTGFDTWIGNGAAGILDIDTAGSLDTSSKWIFVGNGTGGNGTLNVNSGGTLTSNNDVRLGTSPAAGQLNVTGGTVTVARVVSGTLGTISVSNGGKLTTSNAGTANGSPDIVRLTTSSFTAGSLVQGARNISFAAGTSSIDGGTVDAADQVFVGQGVTNTLEMGGGALNSNNWMVVGINANGNGTLNLSGGTINATDTSTTAFTTIGANNNAVGVVNQSGGIWNQGGLGIQMAEGGTGSGTYNLTGGDLYTPRIYKGTGTSAILNLNGGIMHATKDNEDFISSGVVTNLGVSGATIDSSTFNVTAASTLTGAGSLEKVGDGSLTLSAVPSYTGTTTVSAGKLVMGGAPSTAGLSVASGATLGIEEPANTLGSLTVPTASFGAGATLNFETSTGDASEKLIVTGSSGLTFSTLNLNLYLDGSTSGSFAGTYTVIEYSGVLNGIVGDIGLLNPRPGYNYIISDTGAAITVEVQAGDTDSDGMDDLYEQNNGLDYLDPSDAAGNLDGDYATNLEEYTAGTDPNDPNDDPNNLDNDGLQDAWEIATFGSTTAQTGAGDPDGDLATNLEEYQASTSPLNGDEWPDSDSDLMNDAWEATFSISSDGTTDTDGDGFTDKEEHDASTDPSLATGSGISPIWTSLKHRWSFNGDLTDSVGGSDATIVDVGANDVTQAPTTVTLMGGDKASSDYIQLGTNLTPDSTTPITIELWAKQNTLAYWNRIFSFHTAQNDELFMSWNAWTNTGNTDRVSWVDTTGNFTWDNANQPYGTTDEYHIVMTLEPLVGTNGQTRVTVYSAPSTATDLGPARIVAETYVNLVNFQEAVNTLGSSPWPDVVSNTTYNEVRIWEGALTGWMAEKMHDLGPDSVTVNDLDGDHLPDDWEAQYGFDATSLDGDDDSDTFSNYAEYVAGSNPNSSVSTPLDTDADGLADAWEITHFGNIQAQDGSGDPDQDGLTNEQEETANSDPNDDEDGMPAAWEIFWFGDTTTANATSDTDGDGILDINEYLVSQPNNILSTPTDVNGDGIADASQHTLAASDIIGTTSFNTGLNWNDSLAPTAGETYIVDLDGLRTPTADGDYAFAGNRIDLVETYNGLAKLLIKGTGTINIPLIKVNGGEVLNASNTNGTVHVAGGTVEITDAAGRWGALTARNAALVIDSALAGQGTVGLWEGPVSFTNDNTFTGNYFCGNGGSIILETTGSLKFVIGSNGVNNSIGGDGAATLDGAFNIDLAGASSTPGDQWDLLGTTGAITVNPNFTVVGFTPDAGVVGARIWTLASYQYDEATGILSVPVPAGNDSDSDGMDDTWETNNGLIVGSNDSLDDNDGDGTINITEFRLNLDPGDGASSFKATLSGADVTWQGVAGLSFTVQRSNNLSAWTDQTTVIGVDGTNTYTDPAPLAGKGFYRVLLNP